MDRSLNLFMNVWNWFILANIFLAAALIIFSLETSVKTIVLFITCFIVFFFSLYQSYINRKELFKETRNE